jgi:hypothetical protein
MTLAQMTSEMQKFRIFQLTLMLGYAIITSGRASISVIGLKLSGDNERVSGGQFITRGTTGMKESCYKCNHIWEYVAQDNIFKVYFPTLDIFTFEEGGPPSAHTNRLW